jgi:hypothetical protein
MFNRKELLRRKVRRPHRTPHSHGNEREHEHARHADEQVAGLSPCGAGEKRSVGHRRHHGRHEGASHARSPSVTSSLSRRARETQPARSAKASEKGELRLRRRDAGASRSRDAVLATPGDDCRGVSGTLPSRSPSRCRKCRRRQQSDYIHPEQSSPGTERGRSSQRRGFRSQPGSTDSDGDAI